VIGRVLGVLGAIVGAVFLAAIVLFVFVAKHYRMPSSSMEPTLHCARPGVGCRANREDRFTVFTFLGYDRGDIVAFKTPELAAERCGAAGVFVKRIIALPGETWAERQGYVYVDGKKLDEPYVRSGERDFMSHARVKLGAGQFFVMGDNRASSCDSRVWGPVPKKDIIGKVFAVWWPPTRIRFM